jgi:hypothetical protein
MNFPNPTVGWEIDLALKLALTNANSLAYRPEEFSLSPTKNLSMVTGATPRAVVYRYTKLNSKSLRAAGYANNIEWPS